ncbi:MAG: DUF4129 domain-containing protein [Acidimicrobiia bacterium]
MFAVAAVIALVALGSTGEGLLVPAANQSASTASGFRLLGIGVAVVATLMVLTPIGRGAFVPPDAAVSVIFVAAAIMGGLAIASLTASDLGKGEEQAGTGGEQAGPPPAASDAGGQGEQPPPEGPGGAGQDTAQRVVMEDGLGGEDEVGELTRSGEERFEPGTDVDFVDGIVADTLLDASGSVRGNFPEGADIPEDAAEVVSDEPGKLTLGQRGTVPDPTTTTTTIPVPPEPPESESNLLLWVLCGLALLLFLGLFSRRPERDPVAFSDDDDRTPERRAVADAALKASIDRMLSDNDPRTAIIGAYGKLLDVLEEFGAGRRPEEGPHEHLYLVLTPLGIDPEPVHDLAELFVLAKFTDREVTDDDRLDALHLLEQARADLRRADVGPEAVPV